MGAAGFKNLEKKIQELSDSNKELHKKVDVVGGKLDAVLEYLKKFENAITHLLVIVRENKVSTKTITMPLDENASKDLDALKSECEKKACELLNEANMAGEYKIEVRVVPKSQRRRLPNGDSAHIKEHLVQITVSNIFQTA